MIGFKDQQFTILIGGNARGRRGQTTVYVEDVESIEFDSNSGNTRLQYHDDSSARNNPPTYRDLQIQSLNPTTPQQTEHNTSSGFVKSDFLYDQSRRQSR